MKVYVGWVYNNYFGYHMPTYISRDKQAVQDYINAEDNDFKDENEITEMSIDESHVYSLYSGKTMNDEEVLLEAINIIGEFSEVAENGIDIIPSYRSLADSIKDFMKEVGYLKEEKSE